MTVTVSAGGATEADITLDAVDEDVQLELERLRAKASCPGGTCDAGAREDGAIAASNAFDNQTSKDAESVEPVRRETAYASPAASQASVPSDEPVFRATGRDILLYALSDITFLASALVLWGFWQRIADVLPDWVARRTADSVMGIVTRGALAVALLALFCVVLLLMVSVASAIVRFHGFSVWRRGDDLVVSRGLLTRRVSTIPVSRIQTVTVRSNPLRRMLGLCSVQLGLSVGEADDDASDTANADGRSGADILPVIGTSRLWRVLPRMLPEWGLTAPSGLRLARTGRGLTRYYALIPALTLTAGSVAAALAIGLWTAPWRWAALAVPAVALLWLVSRLMRCRADGFAPLSDAEGVLPRRIVVTGVAGFTWQTLFTRRSRVQSLTRSTPVWRERLGVERATMPLFVSNGTSEVTFLALRRRDAERLDAWFAPDVRSPDVR